MRTTLAFLTALLLLGDGPAHAADTPDVGVIVARMRTVLEPAASSTRKFTLTVSGDGAKSSFTAAQARKTVAGVARMLTLVLAPSDQRGVASLILQGTNGKPDVRALWIPAVRRTRMLTPVGGYEAFLNSDFTYADLGFVDPRASYTLLGTGTRNGKAVYEVQAVPRETWYYSRIVSYVDQATMMPVERDYYDPAGVLWKTEKFEDITVIDGTPVATHITMTDQQAKQSSTMIVEGLKFGIDLPDSLFDPRSLRAAIDSPVWPAVH